MRAGQAARCHDLALGSKIDIIALDLLYQARRVKRRTVTQNASAATPQPANRRVTERRAWAAHGVPVLVVGVGLLIGAVALLAQGSGAGTTAPIVGGVLLLVAGALAVLGLT